MKNEPPLSSLCTVPFKHQPDQHLVIGVHANNRFFGIAKRVKAPKKSQIKKNVSVEVIVEFLKLEFSKLVLEPNKEITPAICQRVIDRAVFKICSGHESVTHYIPILFYNNYDGSDLDFGSLKLTSLDLAIEEIKAGKRVESDWDTNTEEYFKQFNAMLVIPVPACESNISYERAFLTAKVFIGIHQLFSYGERSSDIGLTPLDKNHFTFYHLTRDDQGQFSISQNIHFAKLQSKSWQTLMSKDATALHQIYSVTIDRILDPAVHEVISNRLIDAILLYSEALTDKNPLSQIVKFIMAIERIVTTDNIEVSAKVETRASKLISIFNGDREHWREKIKDAYDLRSKLVHGAFSLSNANEIPSEHSAQKLANSVIHAAAIFFYQIGLEKKVTEKQLGTFFKKIESIDDYTGSNQPPDSS